MDELYKQNIIEHYKNPANKGILSDFDIKLQAKNVNCGDDVVIYIKLGENKEIEDISFDGYGCAISTASSSMLLEKIKGKTIEELKTISPGDIYNMLGIKISPNRVNCALLSYKAINDGIDLNK
jgi:nitrogen fixation NifU-like protein